LLIVAIGEWIGCRSDSRQLILVTPNGY